MENNHYYLVLEVTSKEVKLLAGYSLNNQIYVLDKAEIATNGVEDGYITSLDSVARAITIGLRDFKEHLKFDFKKVLVLVPSMNLLCKADNGQTTTVDGNNLVQHVDTMNILMAMKKRNQKLFPEHKIIDIVPDTFLLEDSEPLDNEPLGKYSPSLSLHGMIYGVDKVLIEQYSKLLEMVKLDLERYIPSCFASSLYLSSKAKLPDSYILLDIGFKETTISQIHNKNQIIKSKIFVFGGDDITKDIQKKFNLSYEDAENLKLKYGLDKEPSFNLEIAPKVTIYLLKETIQETLKKNLALIKDVIDNEFDVIDDTPLILIGGTSNLNNIYPEIANELERTVYNFDCDNIGARNKNLINLLGGIKYLAQRSLVSEEENLSSTITRIDTKKIDNKKKYKFDEEL